MDGGVFPAIAEVAFVGEEADQSFFPDEAEPLRPLVVVFVDFWQPGGEGVGFAVDGMVSGQFDKVQLWEHLFHLAADERFQSVVVIDMQKTAGHQVFPKVGRLLFGKDHVPVTGHVDKRQREDIAASGFDGDRLRVDVGAEGFIAIPCEVGQ